MPIVSRLHRRYKDSRSKEARQYRKWYHTAFWQKTRREYLRENHWCVRCQEAATVVDHIVPHRGDVDLFCDPKNLQSLCKPCHDAKQWEERGVSKASQVTVIHGPPNSGKTTWARSHAQQGDLVWDMDAVAGAMGFPHYPRPPDVATLLIHNREQLVRLVEQGTIERAVYLIVTDQRVAERLAARMRATLVDVMKGK